MTLNNFFDEIYCINLSRRTDRWLTCCEEFDKQKINVKRISAIDGNPDNIKHSIKEPYIFKNGMIGCALSHLEVIKDAKKNNYSKILVLEDDIEFIENVNDVFFSKISFLPEDWKMLYFGGNHLGNHIEDVNQHFFKIKNTYTTHCLGLKNDMFDVFIERVPFNIDKPIDVIFAEWQKQYASYCFMPHLAWQRKGFSDIDNAYVDYDDIDRKSVV